MPETFSYALQDGLAEITMDDGKVNAMSDPFFDGLNSVLDQAEKDAARAVIIKGRPGLFSAGLNLKVLPTLDQQALAATMTSFGRTMLRVYGFPIPTVAAVSGHAIAGGAMLMHACDLRVMAEGPYRIQLNETAIGLTLPSWAIAIAERGIPDRWHTEAILHARPYTPEEALERGIIDEIARPADQLVEAARARAALAASLDTAAYGATKARQRDADLQRVGALIEKEASGDGLRGKGR
ncbi:MAG: crotonase/enoyl-CoA hydratase family protein [Deltaproteobacteria bacterium]|nr:crotonase/enoyl-CoA hydratase family protein [Deltaproteobacteria bacterium]